jgi:hypothetical protein
MYVEDLLLDALELCVREVARVLQLAEFPQLLEPSFGPVGFGRWALGPCGWGLDLRLRPRGRRRGRLTGRLPGRLRRRILLLELFTASSSATSASAP